MATLKLGIALGSGAARGWAHIGVLQELAKRGFEPQVVAGASVGSLVGAAYAANQLDILEEWSRGLTRMDVFGMLDARFRGGVIKGSRVMHAIGDQLGDHKIEALPIAFGAVATDLITGREVWLRDGGTLTAVRASCGLPGLFSPVRHEGRWLIDGGVCNPVPISLCYALGAEVVIGVNLNGHLAHRRQIVGTRISSPSAANQELRGFEKLSSIIGSLFGRGDGDSEPGMLDVVNASINIMQERITRSRMAGEPPHLEISPYLQDLELMDFHRAADTIKAGRDAVIAVAARLDELKLLLDS